MLNLEQVGKWRLESWGSDHGREQRPWGRRSSLLEFLALNLSPSSWLGSASACTAPVPCGLPTCQCAGGPGGEPHLHAVHVPVSSLTSPGLSNLWSCRTRVVHVRLGGLSMFVNEKYCCLHWGHLFCLIVKILEAFSTGGIAVMTSRSFCNPRLIGKSDIPSEDSNKIGCN